MKKILGVLGLSLMFVSCLAYADEPKETVSVHMQAYHIVKLKKGEKRLPAEKAKPGDVLEYVAAYHNQSKHGVSGLKATLPVPQGLVFIADSPRPRHALASLDGKLFQKIPLKRRVKQSDGSWKQVLVPFEEYRFLRWNIGRLDAGATEKVSARMRLIPVQ